MNNLFSSLFSCFKQKKGYFLLLCLVTILAIILGIYAGISFSGGVLVIDLGNISYIKFLQNDTSLFSMIFALALSLIIFFVLILLFSCKTFLLPLALIFYMYLVYSQAVICVSVVMIYGFLNCIILLLVLIVYVAIIIFLFVLGMLHMACFTNDVCYFKNCFTPRNYILWLLIAVVLVCVIFSFLLSILKSFVILLVY